MEERTWWCQNCLRYPSEVICDSPGLDLTDSTASWQTLTSEIELSLCVKELTISPLDSLRSLELSRFSDYRYNQVIEVTSFSLFTCSLWQACAAAGCTVVVLVLGVWRSAPFFLGYEPNSLSVHWNWSVVEALATHLVAFQENSARPVGRILDFCEFLVVAAVPCGSG